MMTVSSCSDYKSYRSESFVMRYDDLAAISVSRNPDFPSMGINVSNDLMQSRFWCSPFREEGIYDMLCKKHGDFKYNERVSYLMTFEEPSHNACDLLSIKISSDRDFDAEHPAGASLADIVRFVSCSPEPFISSGYKRRYRYAPDHLSYCFRHTWGYYYSGPDRKESEYYPIDKMLCDIVPEDLVLLGPDVPYDPNRTASVFFSLFFEMTPDTAEEHRITVEVNTDDGRVLSGTIVMDFATKAR